MTRRDAALVVLACLVLLGACPPDDGEEDDAATEGACGADADKLQACVDARPGAVRAPH